MTQTTECILIVDDDSFLRERLSIALSRRGFETREASGVTEARQLLADGVKPDRAIVDLRMGDGNGMTLIEPLCQANSQMRIVVLTGFGSITNAVEAIKAGAHNYVTKPADVDQILRAFDTQDLVAQSPKTQSPKAPTLAETEWEHIQRVLADCGGNLTRAADVLDIPRRSLQRKLKKLGPYDVSRDKP